MFILNRTAIVTFDLENAPYFVMYTRKNAVNVNIHLYRRRKWLSVFKA
jgi:hypothetical protein